MFQIFRKCCSKGAAKEPPNHRAANSPADLRCRRVSNGVDDARRPWPSSSDRGESGATAVELAFALPVMLLIILGIIQFGTIFHVRNSMTDAARKAARSLSVGEVNETAAKQAALDSLSAWPMTFTVVTSMPDPNDPEDRDVSVNISVPLSQASLVDIAGLFSTGNVGSSVTMRMEAPAAP